MRAASTVLTLSFAAGLFTANTVQAVGFGRVATATQLGQRLDFAAVVRLEPDEALDRACVAAEVLAGDNLLQPGQVRVTLEGRSDSPDRTVRVTTSTVIDEPVLTISVTVGCGSRTTRKFIAFIDPPGIEMAQPASAADLALLVPQRDYSQVAPLVALLAPLPRRSPTRKRDGSVDRSPLFRAPSDSSAATARGSSRVVAATAAEPASRARRLAAAAEPASGARRLAAAASKPSNAARLQLEAPALTAVVSAPFAAGASLAAVSKSSVNEPTAGQAEALLNERRRVQSLEDGLSRLQADAAASRQTVAGLQSRLEQAEAERYANPLVAGLAAASALLALVLAATMRRRARGPATAAKWWKVTGVASAFGRPSTLVDSDPVAPEALITPDALLKTDALLVPAALRETARSKMPEVDDIAHSRAVLASGPTSSGTSPTAPVEPPSSAGRPDVSARPNLPAVPSRGPVAATSRGAPSGVAAVAQPVRPMPIGKGAPEPSSSVEELIDLEQQAEFFVVLGQDDAAIELLTQHLQDEDPASPLPYLKLLEIHRRRDDQAGYESIRSRFNRDFNAYAPGWDADLREGRTLEEYPDVLAQLQLDWRTPAIAIDTLAASLFRRGAGTPFDLPAYRELLSLYSIARDRAQDAGKDGAGTLTDVDLLLPLGNGPEGESMPSSNAMTGASASPRAGVGSRFVAAPTGPLDLDVSIAAEPARHQPAAGAVGRKTSTTAAIAAHYESLETVPAALRRTAGHPDESAFVDLELEPVTLGEPVVVR